MVGAMQRGAQGVLKIRTGDPVLVSAGRKECLSMRRLQGEAGVRQVQGAGKAGTRQRERVRKGLAARDHR